MSTGFWEIVVQFRGTRQRQGEGGGEGEERRMECRWSTLPFVRGGGEGGEESVSFCGT